MTVDEFSKESMRDALTEIIALLYNSAEVPTDYQDTGEPAAIVSNVKLALEYLADARDSARMYSAQLQELRGRFDAKLNERTAELSDTVETLRNQVQFHRDTIKNLEGTNEGLAQALRIIVSTKAQL